MSEATISEEQVLHNELSFEINQELIHLMKRIVEIQQEKQQLKEIEKEHQKINGELREENKKLKEVIEEVREYVNNLSLEFYDYECNQLIVGKYMIDELLQILDKAKETIK